MKYIHDNPIFFRLLFLVLLSFLMIIAVINFYRYTGSVTDENIFVDTKAHLMISQSMPALLIKTVAKGTLTVEPARQDSLRIGDLIFSIDGRWDFDSATPESLSSAGSLKSDMIIGVLRSFLSKIYFYKFTKGTHIPGNFIISLPQPVLVTTIADGGASDRAGMKIGDLIIRINGQTFKSAQNADRILRNLPSGKSIAYDIVRNGRFLTLKVTLARFGIRMGILAFVLAGLVFMIVGAFIALARPLIKPARLLGLGMLLIGFFMVASSGRRDLLPTFFTHLRDDVMFIAVLIGISAWFHARHYFPLEIPQLTRKKAIVQILYTIAWLASCAAILTQSQVIIAIGILVIVIYQSGIMLYHNRWIPAEYKRMMRIIKIMSVLVVFILLFICFMLYLSGFKDRSQIGYLGLPLAVIPLAYLYIIGKYKLFNLDMRLRRNIQYNLMASAWGLLMFIFGLFMLFQLLDFQINLPKLQITTNAFEVMDTPLSDKDRVFAEKTIMMVLAVALSLLSRKIYVVGKRFLNKKYYRSSYDYRRATAMFAKVLSAKLNSHELAHNLASSLSELMLIKRVGVIFFRKKDELIDTEAYGLDALVWKNFADKIAPQLLALCAMFPNQSRFHVDYLPAELKEYLRKYSLSFITLMRSGSQVLGAIFTGEKLAETPYHQEDLEILDAAGKQAVVALENTYLYEELSKQERVRHELEIARRIQISSLPQTTPDLPGFEIAGTSLPAAEVGGDYFDYLNGDKSGLTIVVGDVSGKGISAALYMSKIQGILRSLHAFRLSPRELFIRANEILSRDLEKHSFITALGGHFDYHSNKMVVTRAGHLPLFYFNAVKAQVESITPKGIGFGLDTSKAFAAELEEKKIKFHSGDVFLFVTDGITEAKNTSGEEFGEEQVSRILFEAAHKNASTICQTITDVVHRFCNNGSQSDDQTIVVVKVL